MELPPMPPSRPALAARARAHAAPVRFIESVREGHRTFLLADEPGLGKTAQSVLAASVANAYPMLAVVPNVVKMNWAREVERWTPQRRATVIHGDGDDVDAFADVFVVNYEILDRHLSWLSTLGFRSMVVDEAHFIKNLSRSARSTCWRSPQRIRDNTPGGDPLLLALTGTPLINDVEDFNAIWRFLGWVKGDKPGPELMRRLEETGSHPRRPRLLPRGPRRRDRHGHRAPQEGGRRQRPAGQAHRRPPRRARRRPRPLDPRRGARARPAAAGELPPDHRRARGEQGDGQDGELDRPTSCELVGTSCDELDESKRAPVAEGRERLHHGPPDRPGEGAARGRLHRAAGRARWARSSSSPSTSTSWTPPSGSSRSRGLRTVSIRGDQTDTSASRPSTRSTTTRTSRSRSARSPPPASASTCRRRRTSCSPSCRGRPPSRRRRSTACTASVRTSRSPRGASSPRTPSTRKIAELIDSKQGLAARALDGSDQEVGSGDSVQLDALIHLLRQALTGR